MGEASLQPRGLSRSHAAAYVGIGTTLFDNLVAAGKMPEPRMIEGRVVWDRHELDDAFAELPKRGVKIVRETNGNPWDQRLGAT